MWNTPHVWNGSMGIGMNQSSPIICIWLRLCRSLDLGRVLVNMLMGPTHPMHEFPMTNIWPHHLGPKLMWVLNNMLMRFTHPLHELTMTVLAVISNMGSMMLRGIQKIICTVADNAILIAIATLLAKDTPPNPTFSPKSGHQLPQRNNVNQ